MISVIEATKIAASRGQSHEVGLPDVPPDPPELLQGATIDLLEDVIEATAAGVNPIDKLLPKLRILANRHGWLKAASVLSWRLAKWYRPDAVPRIPGADQNAMELLRMLPLYADYEKLEASPDWTVPITVLAEAGEEDALNFTACVAFCASVEYLRTDMASRIDREGS